jgi:hypothetical protein
MRSSSNPQLSAISPSKFTQAIDGKQEGVECTIDRQGFTYRLKQPAFVGEIALWVTWPDEIGPV